MNSQHVDGVLVQWGERLFYPSNRIVKPLPTPRLDTLVQPKAAVIRQRIEAIVGRAPQVIVRLAGDGQGMTAIAAHFRYISMNGRLDIEDDRGVVRNGEDAVHDLVDQWRFGGSLIENTGHRREALNLILSMPAGTDAELLKKAVREFAQVELAGHRYVMVLHEHQANPHVHLSVRAEAISGQRLRPYMKHLHRWRETFAEKLRGWGIEADATRQAIRGENRAHEPLWRARDRKAGVLRVLPSAPRAGPGTSRRRADAMLSWAHILKALSASEAASDRELAKRVGSFIRDSSTFKEATHRRIGPEVSAPQDRTAARFNDRLEGRPGPGLDR